MVEMPTLGKRVKIIAQSPSGSTSHQGVVLPGAAPDHLTIKLANGYNISYPLSSVDSIEEIGDSTTPEKSNVQSTRIRIYPSNNHPHWWNNRIKVDYTTGAVIARFEPEELLASVPEILEIANIDAVKLGNMWSDDIRPTHWNKMIDACQMHSILAR